MPNRILRDWTDSLPINTLGDFNEVFFTRLIMKVDDYGRFSANPRLLRSLLFPLRDGIRDSDVIRCLAACEKAGLVRQYTAKEKPLLEIQNFKQRMQTPSKFDPPAWFNGGSPENTVSHREIPCSSESESETKAYVALAHTNGKFEKPSQFQVCAYMKEVGMPETEGLRFVDFYTSKGWLVGKTAMKDWHAAVRTWKGNFVKGGGHLLVSESPPATPVPEDDEPNDLLKRITDTACAPLYAMRFRDMTPAQQEMWSQGATEGQRRMLEKQIESMK